MCKFSGRIGRLETLRQHLWTVGTRFMLLLLAASGATETGEDEQQLEA